MNFILRSISFVFHPLIMPLCGILFYFSKSPRYIPEPILKAKIIAVFLLTVLLPILLFFLLKTRGKISSIYLPNVSERIVPLVLNVAIVIVILQRILPQNELEEPYYFFVGILGSTIACLILAVLKFKASIHMIAAGGILMFIIALSIHFSINIMGSIALMSVITGAVATSRLHVKAHDSVELLIGFLIGVVPQIVVMNYWL